MTRARKARWTELRLVLLGAAMVGVAFAAVANLVCAILYGAVFLARGADWLYLDDSPVRFLASVAASVIAGPFCAFMGVIALMGAKDERRFLENLYPATPPYEDPTRVAVAAAAVTLPHGGGRPNTPQSLGEDRPER